MIPNEHRLTDGEYLAPMRCSTGVVGLDEVLPGGWPGGRLYLVVGSPGSGKTTLGIQFLIDGARQGERVLYVTLSETDDEIRQVAASHGWSLEGVDLYELTAAEPVLGLDDDPSMFDSSEVEFRATSRSILDEIERVDPARVVFDSLSELALLAGDPLAFRRELLLLKQALHERDATVLLLGDQTTVPADHPLESLVHGVLALEDLAPAFGTERRRLRVKKLRGSRYRGGYHDYRIRTGGLEVFPRMQRRDVGQATTTPPGSLSSGDPSLDSLLGGGLRPGSTTLLLGPSGSGKSCVVGQFIAGALHGGVPAVLLLFDESPDGFLQRSVTLGIDLRPYLTSGLLRLVSFCLLDAADMPPGEFGQRVRQLVTEARAGLVAIDSLTGYMHALPEERFLSLHIHETLLHLNRSGICTLLSRAWQNAEGAPDVPADLTWIADAVVLMRFVEHRGRIRRAISMVKNRAGTHDNRIRELEFGSRGIRVGSPLTDLSAVPGGVMTEPVSLPAPVK